MTSQEVYNTYLSVSRGIKNKPWKPRKDFTDFDKTEQGHLCIKLSFFFTKFPQISPKDFFQAPYLLYKDEDYFDLKFYLTQKAISCYTSVQKLKQEESPDSPGQISSIIDSVKFIAEKCIKQNISFQDYCSQKNNYVPEMVLDFANKNINLYLLLNLPNFIVIFDMMAEQDKEIYLSSFYKNIAKYKIKLNNSSKAKKIIHESIKRLNTITKNID